jgi:hypothetical protein
MGNNLSFNFQSTYSWSPDISEDQYELKILKKMQTRRMTKMAKIAIDLALQTVGDQTIDFLVYSSRHGELILSTDLINSILGGEIPSPIKFSQSTHNAIAGLFSLSHKEKSPMTAISAGENSLIMGLMAAAAHLKLNKSHKVLFIFADAVLPELYSQVDDSSDGFAITSLMTNGDEFELFQNPTEETNLSKSLFLQELIENKQESGFFIGRNYSLRCNGL